MEEQKLSFPNRHWLNNNIWAKTLLWNFRSELRRASLVAVPQVRAKLGTAPLKQVRRAVSLHLHPPLPRLAKLSPSCFPITGGRGERGVEGSPEVPAFWGESEWLVPPDSECWWNWHGLAPESLQRLVWLCGQDQVPLEASFLGGRRRVGVWCPSFLSGCTRDWLVFRLTWSADGQVDILWMPVGRWEKRTVVWLAAAAPKSLQYWRQTPEGDHELLKKNPQPFSW